MLVLFPLRQGLTELPRLDLNSRLAQAGLKLSGPSALTFRIAGIIASCHIVGQNEPAALWEHRI